MRNPDFVEAAFGSGGTFRSVVLRHILPNSLTAVLALLAVHLGGAILAISALGFLGFGAPPPTPEWGLLIAEGRQYLDRVVDDQPAGPHRRAGRARRQLHFPVAGQGAPMSTVVRAPLLAVAACASSTGTGRAAGPEASLRPEAGRDGGTGRRVRLGQDHPGAGGPRPPAGERPDRAGTIRLNGADISGWSGRQLDAIRGTRISLIPQDPTSSLNPVRTIGSQVGEIFRIHRRGNRPAIEARVVELLARVGLSDPDSGRGSIRTNSPAA